MWQSQDASWSGEACWRIAHRCTPATLQIKHVLHSVRVRGKNMKTVKLCLNDPDCCKALVRYSIFFRPVGWEIFQHMNSRKPVNRPKLRYHANMWIHKRRPRFTFLLTRPNVYNYNITIVPLPVVQYHTYLLEVLQVDLTLHGNAFSRCMILIGSFLPQLQHARLHVNQ